MLPIKELEVIQMIDYITSEHIKWTMDYFHSCILFHYHFLHDPKKITEFLKILQL